jgi:nucleotide-binding universal stress UspA family protein
MKIVVPLDMSDTANRAIGLGADIARGLGDDLLLVTVSGQRLMSDLAPLAKSEGVPVPEMIEAFLKSTLAELEDVPVDYRVIPGENAPQSLVDFVASNRDVRMIVMATHGRTGIEKWRLGNVTERVVRHATVPVTVVPKSR